MWTHTEKRDTENMIYKLYDELKNYGFPLYLLTRVKFVEGVKYLGKCSRKSGSNEVTISINHAVLEVPDKLQNTILHELCHAIVGTHGHNQVWKHYARVVGIHYGTVIQQYAPVYAAAVIESKRKYNHRIACEYCDREWKFSRAGKIVKYVQTHYSIKCPCGKGYLRYTRIS